MGSTSITRGRWLVKKVARRGLAYGSAASGMLWARRLVDRVVEPGPRVRVLTYHRFGFEKRCPFCMPPLVFDAQMRHLARRRLAVSLDDVASFVSRQGAVRDGAVLVTIDDGCLSTLTEAVPLLRRHGVPAVAFVTPSLIGQGILGDQPEPYLTWAQLREVAAAGVAIGAHGYTHRSQGQLPIEEAREEARRARQTLEDRLGVPVTSFAYPFGTHGDFTSETERALAEAGYTIAFNSQHGSIRPGMDPISLPRVKVEAGEGMRMFQLSCRGAMDPWRVVDGSMWRLQRVRSEIVPRQPPG